MVMSSSEASNTTLKHMLMIIHIRAGIQESEHREQQKKKGSHAKNCLTFFLLIEEEKYKPWR